MPGELFRVWGDSGAASPSSSSLAVGKVGGLLVSNAYAGRVAGKSKSIRLEVSDALNSREVFSLEVQFSNFKFGDYSVAFCNELSCKVPTADQISSCKPFGAFYEDEFDDGSLTGDPMMPMESCSSEIFDLLLRVLSIVVVSVVTIVVY